MLDNERKGDIKDSYFNVDKAKSDPGWKADYFIEEGLAKTIGYYCS